MLEPPLSRAMHKALQRLLLLGPWALVACGPRTEIRSCPASQELVGGSPTADILAISADQKRTIGRVRPLQGLPGFFCTGVRVAPHWVLTAKHCNQGTALTFELPETIDSPAASYTGINIVLHPDHDALLIEFGELLPGAGIELLGEAIDDSWIATPVQLAGYGVRTDGSVATELEFLIERVIKVEADTLVVDGEGRSGACLGDSGGPILTRNSRGEMVVAGVLTTGSASCRDIDRYVRADILNGWAREQTRLVATQESDCGALGSGGLCRRGTAIWCEGDKIRAEHCEAGLHCGWATSTAGYRCLAANEDACGGVDDLGVCTGNSARRCVEGRLVERQCGECDFECAWDAPKGHFECLPKP